MTPRQLARLARRRLREAGRPAIAVSSRRFFKAGETVSFFGVNTATLRRLERETFHEVRGVWMVRDAVVFADEMLEAAQLEAKVFGLLTLHRFQRTFPLSLFRTAERWLRQNRCDNWAAVDALGPKVVTPLLLRYAVLVPRVERWARSRNVWVRRAAAVSLVLTARRGILLDQAYRVVLALRDDREDLIHKACGWLLREAGKTDAARLDCFLVQRGAALSRTTVRYAIERFPERKRKKLLEVTRSQA